MEQFSLEKYLENPSRKVVTRQGKSVRIICTDRRHTDSWPIVALEDYGDGEFVIYANIDGRTDMCSENIHDLFFADEEEEPQSIEIPFGAKDSELVRDEYYIPEGCEARIEGNKVIIERVQKEEKLTEFEKELINLVFKYKYWDSSKDEVKQCIKKDSKLLLDLSRKEIRKEQQEKLGTLEMPIDVTEPYYIKGKQDTLKDLPKWKKTTEHKDLEKHIAILEDGKVLLSNYLEEGDYYIDLEDLKTLPKEE